MTLRPVALVTGAGGLVGQHIVSALSTITRVIAVCRNKPLPVQMGESIQADLVSLQAVQALKSYRPDFIVHTAAVLPVSNDDHHAAQANLAIDRNIIKLADDLQLPLVFISSISVYESTPIPWHEAGLVAPSSAYAAAKRAAELSLLKRASPSVSLRISSPYSAIDVARPGVLYHFVREVAAGRTLRIIGSGERKQDFIHALDIARAVTLIFDNWCIKDVWPQSKIFNVAQGKSVSTIQLAQIAIAEWGGGRAECVPGDGQDSYNAEIEITLAESELGWKPSISIQQGVSQLIRRIRGCDEDWFNL